MSDHRAEARRRQRDSDARYQYLARCRNTIHREGWMVQYVGPGDGLPEYAYTVGMTPAGLPELIVFGWPPVVASKILNELAAVHIHDDINGGDALDDVLEGTRLWVVEVTDDTDRYFRTVHDLWPPLAPCRGLQLCWPDKDGHFQWDDEFEAGGMVPLLGEAPHG